MPNQEFLKFILVQSSRKKFDNLNLLLELESKYKGIFAKVMSNFDTAKSFKQTLDDNGKLIFVPWKDALIKFFLCSTYSGVTNNNADIAELFGKKGVLQGVFDVANNLRQEAESKNIPEHLLGKPLQEETILESIEKIGEQTSKEIKKGRKKIEEIYGKQFTYEWLSKRHPANAIIGMDCSCCCTSVSQYYGKYIADAAILSKDVQNLVVRNYKGEIIAKGTMYLNKKFGYAVINDFEINRLYKSREIQEAYDKHGGVYNVQETSPEEQTREKIFEAFERGVRAFVEEYNRDNPPIPLTQVNIGFGYNRLKKQVMRLKKATSLLAVPEEYSFDDAEEKQYILYQEPEKENHDEGEER